MKFLSRILSIALVVVLLIPACAMGAGQNYDKMTEEELQSVIDQARLAMTKYHPLVEDGTVLFSDKSVSITYTGNCSIDMFGDFVADVVITNNTNSQILFSLEEASCNGWAVDISVSPKIPAGKKAKGVIRIQDIAESTDITTIDDIKDIEAKIHYFDTTTFNNLIKPQRVVWNFNK